MLDGLATLIEAEAANRELKDRAGTSYDRDELREHATTRWLEYLVEDRLVFDGLTPSPNFVSCTSGCMRAIIPSTGDLDCCIICCLI